MANDIPASEVLYDGDGTAVQFSVPFEYIDQAYVFAEVDGATASFTWVTSDTIQFDTAPPAGVDNIRIFRSTLASSMLAIFSADTPFLTKYVDKDNTQLLHLIQEVRDYIEAGLINEAALRAAADALLQAGIDAEEAARKAADIVLQEYIEALAATSGPGLGYFLQSGEAAKQRTFQDRLRDTLHATDFSTVDAAVAAAVESGRVLYFPPGTYTGDTITVSGGLRLELAGGAHVQRDIYVLGERFTASTSVALSGAWTSFPVGTTTISGNFTGFSAGDVIAITLAAGDGGSASYNEAGVFFTTIAATDQQTITLTDATTMAFRNPTVHRLTNAAKYTGSLAVGAVSIPGDYTSQFAVGDLVRVENTTGTGGVNAVKFYFEVGKVKSISSSALVLDAALTHTHTNPWLVKMATIPYLSVRGPGRLNRLVMRAVDSPVVENVQVDRLTGNLLYNASIRGVHARGLAEASTVNFTWLFGRNSVADVYAAGSSGATDNAGVKFMSVQNTNISNLRSSNTTSTSSQGNYGCFVDAYYTPYRIWNTGMVVDGIIAEPPRGGSSRAIWFYGVKGASLRGLYGGRVYLQGCVDTQCEVTIPRFQFEIQDCIRSDVRGQVGYVQWRGCKYSSLDVSMHDTSGNTNTRGAWIYAGSNDPETGETYTSGTYNVFEFDNRDSTSALTCYVQQQTYPTWGAKCRDAVTASISFGSDVAYPRMYPNFLQGTIPTQNAWVGPRGKGQLWVDGGYQDGLIRLGNYYLWVDSAGLLRIHTAKPTSSLLGTAVGDQTAATS